MSVRGPGPSRRARDVVVLLRLVLSLVRVGRLLHAGGFARAVESLSLSVAGPLPERARPVSPGTARDVRVAVRLTRLLGDRVTCLHKALALQDVLLSFDVPASVVLGVRDKAGFGAHAWLETPHGRIDPNRLDLTTFDELGRFVPEGAA